MDMIDIIDLKSKRKEIKNRIKEYTSQLEQVNLILPELYKNEGAGIDRHLQNRLNEALPFEVVITFRFGMAHLKTDHVDMLLGYQPGYIVSGEKIKEYSICYTLNEKRIPELKEGLNNLTRLVTRWNKHIKALNEMHECASKYGMEYDLFIRRQR